MHSGKQVESLRSKKTRRQNQEERGSVNHAFEGMSQFIFGRVMTKQVAMENIQSQFL